MKKELKDTISTYIGKYGKTLEMKLGLIHDDLLNDIREQIWKGLITHNPQGRANLKTYLNTLIKNRFGVLFKRSKIKKNNMVQYYADVYSTSGVEDEYLVTEETGETVFMRRQIIMQHQCALVEADRYIYECLLQGNSIDEMMQMRAMTRVNVIGAIKRVAELIARSREEAAVYDLKEA